MTTLSRGRCAFCYETFGASAIGKHVESCEKRKPAITGQEESSMHLSIKGSDGLSMYWLHVEASSNSKLQGLDAFLRKTWVECCGHLSMFEIGGTSYSIQPQQEFDDESMNTKLDSVLTEGTKFSYQYDFGTTTSLDLKVLSVRCPSRLGKTKKLEVLARNIAPEINCGNCGKEKATNVCSACIWEGEKAWVCDGCSKKHKCGEEMLLPVVNSPRVGMCGYTG